jgi:ADP-heptose:LPS heptosyltransferase
MAQSDAATIGRRILLASLNAIAGGARRNTSASDTNNASVRRILVVELWNIGDVVLLMPFLAQLRALYPQASVILLARPHARVVLDGTDLIDEYIDDDSPADNWLSLNPLEGGWRELWNLRRRLRELDFDLAFQCRLHVREHVILALSGARRRIGYAFGEGDRMLTDAIPVDDPHRNKVDDWLHLLSAVGGPVATESPTLHVSESERAQAAALFARNGIEPGDAVIGIHPGASLPEKRWPLDRFAEVARDLVARSDTRVVVFADPAGYGASLDEIDGVVLARTGLRELIALIERCTLLVCNDSGPMHLAGGLGVPTVAVFGAGIARWFAPLGTGHELVSTLTNGAGLESVEASRVLAAIERALSAKPALRTRQPFLPPLSPT